MVPSSWAQTPVDAGALRQQIEKQQEKTLPPRSTTLPEGGPVLKETPESDKVRITVKSFRFTGNTLVPEKDLAAVVAPYLNHPISFSELQNAAAAVGEVYRAKGLIVRSFLPRQDIKDGIVTIAVVEGTFGQTKIEGDEHARISDAKIVAMVAAQQKSGDSVSTTDLDRALLLIDDLPGVTVSGRLQPGDHDGETDIAIKRAPERLVTGTVAVDNEGSRDTGQARAYGFMQFSGLAEIGDQTSLYALDSRGLHFGQVDASVPLGNDGLRVGVSGSAMNYKLLPSAFSALNGKGASTSIGLRASYPIVRARKENLYVEGNYDHKYFNNESLNQVSSHYHTDDFTAALRGNIFDDWGGANTARIAVTTGSLDLGTIDSGESRNLDGGFTKYTANFSRVQNVAQNVTVYAALSGQYSPDRYLDSSERFYLGGADGVRAYPVSEGSGSNGVLFTFEPRWNFSEGFQASTFYDHGYVGNRDGSRSYSLRGAGLALAWQSTFGLNMKGTWAHRLGDNPNPTTTGNDQDGSLIKDRFWLTASMPF